MHNRQRPSPTVAFPFIIHKFFLPTAYYIPTDVLLNDNRVVIIRTSHDICFIEW